MRACPRCGKQVDGIHTCHSGRAPDGQRVYDDKPAVEGGEEEWTVIKLMQNKNDRLEARIRELEAEVLKWKRIRTPTHGPCCTCQACGQNYDDCRCDLDEVADDLRQALEEVGRQRETIKELSNACDLGALKSQVQGRTFHDQAVSTPPPTGDSP